MKKINSLNELQNFFEQLGVKKEKGQGFVSWTLDSKDLYNKNNLNWYHKDNTWTDLNSGIKLTKNKK